MERLRLALVFLTLFITYCTSAQENPWKLKKDKNGIKVFFRDGEGTKIKELRFETTVKASLSSIVALLDDIPGYQNWVYKSTRSSMVERVSPTEMYYYEEINFPWPMSNRDVIAHSTLRQDPVTKIIESNSVSAHTLLPENDGIVRITILDFRWKFTPVEDGVVNVDYYLKSDPGGIIPAWLINLAIDQGPLKTMEKFKELLENKKYKNVQLAYIDEP